MPTFDQRHAHLHKRIFNEFLDALDKDIVTQIINNPNCEEAQLLIRRVDAELRKILYGSAAVE